MAIKNLKILRIILAVMIAFLMLVSFNPHPAFALCTLWQENFGVDIWGDSFTYFTCTTWVDDPAPYSYQYQYQYEYQYQTPAYQYQYQYQAPAYATPGYPYPTPATYGTPYGTPAYGTPVYGTPSGGIPPGGWGCNTSTDCVPNLSVGSVATCCLETNADGSHMCASTGGGPYCSGASYSYEYQYQTPAYATPAYANPGYATPAYGTPAYGTPAYATPSSMSGTLTPAASSCIISSGQSSCNINFSWTTANPVGTSAVTKPTSVTVATGNSGSNVPFAVKYDFETFYLYNNAVLLAQSTVTSSCASGTAWNGSICSASYPYPTPVYSYQTPTTSSGVLSSDKTTIYAGDQITLIWSSSAVSCTGTNFDTGGAPSGSLIITPPATTTYSILCSDGSAGSVKVTVKKKPFFKEN